MMNELDNRIENEMTSWSFNVYSDDKHFITTDDLQHVIRCVRFLSLVYGSNDINIKIERSKL